MADTNRTIGGKFWRFAGGIVRQILCTEYGVGVGIGWHRDKPHFDKVFGLSLGAACKFRFRRRIGKNGSAMRSMRSRARST